MTIQRMFRIATENHITFVRTKIKAEFFKTDYTVDISLTADGGIIEGQCECGAGHCKHICYTLYASLKLQPLELLCYM